jgi:hypothetical protein
MDNKLSEKVDFTKIDISIMAKFFAITLPISLDSLKKIEKYRSEALELKNEDGSLKFKVASGNTGSISNFGVTFNEVTRDDRKLAVMTVEMKGDIENAKEYIASEHGRAILNLKTVISKLGETTDSIENEMEEVIGYIRFADEVGGSDGSGDDGGTEEDGADD